MTKKCYLSDEFFAWMEEHYSKKLAKKSYNLYLHYASNFSNFIQKDFFEYTKEDADNYCSLLHTSLQDNVLKPKSVYNEIGILSVIARELETSLDIPDNFSSQERPSFEYNPLSKQNLPSTSEFDTILTAASKYDPTGTMHAALYLIGVYALSKEEIITLSTENMFVQQEGLVIKRKEYKVSGITLPKLILLDAGTCKELLPFYETMKKRAESGEANEHVLLFTNPKGKAFTSRTFSYAYKCITESVGLNYTIRDLRSGALIRIAHVGGSEALYETAGLRSVWGERYVAATDMLNPLSTTNHSMNAYNNFVMLPKDNLGNVLSACYHIMLQEKNNIRTEIVISDGVPSAKIILDNEKHFDVDEHGNITTKDFECNKED